MSVNTREVVVLVLVLCIVHIYSYSSVFHRRPQGNVKIYTSATGPDVDDKLNTGEDVKSLPNLSSLSDVPSNPPPFVVPVSEEDDFGVDADVDSSNDLDPYADILNFEAPVNEDNKLALLSQWSIDKERFEDSESKESKAPAKPPQWEHWDAFMDEQFGDMDREISMNHEDRWILELRDAVELKRGMAIWSKRSDEEVKREMKKYLAAKALKVPDYVANIVRCVYLEKIMTMKEMRKDHELDVINFRKWMIEKRKKTQKDPIAPAKLEVSKNWLLQHPNIFETQITTEMPSVVMDEKKQASLSSTSMITVSDKNSGTPAATGRASAPASASKAGITPNTIVTYSMLNWDKDVEEEMSKSSLGIDNDSHGTVNDVDRFYIDDLEMCLCTEGDYYVVL